MSDSHKMGDKLYWNLVSGVLNERFSKTKCGVPQYGTERINFNYINI
jgi:hypothetical protein